LIQPPQVLELEVETGWFRFQVEIGWFRFQLCVAMPPFRLSRSDQRPPKENEVLNEEEGNFFPQLPC